MKAPLIAIIGSAETGRTYEPPLQNPAGAKAAAQNLGKALALGGYHIAVYAAYIESDVVRGYVASGKATKGSIVVLYATGQEGAEAFGEYAKHANLFDPHQDDSEDWEMSFYRSLAAADGLVLIGGGRSTLIAGVIALTYRIPVVALAKYGGSALKIWKSLKGGRSLADEPDANAMAQGETEAAAAAWVLSLKTQSVVQAREKSAANRTGSTLVTLLLLFGWVVLIPIGDWLLPKDSGTGAPFAFKLILFLAPMISGASGATIRAITPDEGEMSVRSAVKGVAAGVISAVLYIAAQIVSNPQPYNTTVLLFAVAFGFIAGFTFDRVFKRIETIDPLQNNPIEKIGKK